jgi:autotransporter-associated beta strand protein
LTWTGVNNGAWDFSTANWSSGGNPTIYADGDFVQFFDGANNNTVNLTTSISPAGSIIVSNNVDTYTFNGSGYIAGSGNLLKQGSGTLVLDNSGVNTYTGDTTINDGIIQIGNNDANGSLPGAVIDNGGLIFSRSGSPTINNQISGGGYVMQSASGSTLTLSGNNTFAGDAIVTNNSTLKIGSGSALGGSSGNIIIADGSALDINNNNISKPVIVSGTGMDGNGAIYNSSGGYPYISSITLTGDTTFNVASRWDLSNSTLSTGGNAYNLTLNNSSYMQWQSSTIDSALGNVTLTGGTLGLVDQNSFGNPDATLTLATGSTLIFYSTSYVNKQVDFQAGATITSYGNSVMNGTMTLESGVCSFTVPDGNSLTLSNILTGSGVLYQNSGKGTLTLAGDSPSYTGNIALYNGTLVLDSSIGGSITSQSGTSVAGAGVANGLVDISGTLYPGSSGGAGAFHALGGLTLESGASVTYDLSSSATSGNDSIQVTGDLNLNGNNVNINLIGGGLADGTYTLATYTGNLNGSFGSVATIVNTAYTLTLTNVTTTTPKQIQLLVSGTETPNLLIWNNANGNNQWDVGGSANWTNVTTHSSPSVFNYLDEVVLNDSIANASIPGTNVTIPAGQIIVPTAITNDSTLNYNISGGGVISGNGTLVKLGTSTLSLELSNNATGPVIIGGGTLQTLADNTLLAASSITVSNGATFDFAGHAHNSTNPIVIAGNGVNGKGAIYNSTGGIYGELLNIVLADDATVGQFGQGRWDLNSGSQISGAHNLTINWNGDYGEWNNVTIGSTVQSITLTNGNIGMKFMDSGFQNPGTVFTASTNGQVTFWNGGFNGSLNLLQGSSVSVYSDPSGWAFNGDTITFDDGVTWTTYGNSGNEPINSAIILNGIAHIRLGDHNLLFTNVISGLGGFLSEYWNHAMILAASNTYTGPTIINQGGNSLYVALTNNGSISHSSLIFFGGGDPNSLRMDVTGRDDQTFTLANGQTLAGVGAINGKLVVSAGATISPAGTNITLGITAGSNPTGTLSANNDIVLNGTTILKLNGSANNDVIQTSGNIQFGGTLTLQIVSSTPLAAGDSFQLFNATGYSGAFSSTNLPALSSGLFWDLSGLSSGLVKVVGTGGTGPLIGNSTVADGNLIFSGTGGAANGTYYVLTATNLSSPLIDWLPVQTNTFDASGNFTVTNTLDVNAPQVFYRIKQP